ncbi:hypothetical protein [Streptomyces sp. CBMA152]|uniref:hypothetical protein n=1 Tax=Streptomyces sp. CBMA152 TaxID=1896312 RepID=UPI00166074FB|nr:hypothetical protein [Streptomyces sp. CBMA152]MBD0747797.1 hypothetical protein [Streptomyces sp. CBMA152]
MTTTEAVSAVEEPVIRMRLRRFLPPSLIAVLVVVSAVFLVMERELRDSPAASNRALTDSTATGEVLDEVSTAVGRVFTYDPATLARTRQDARSLLAGEAAKEYDGLFAQVQQRVGDQQLTLTTRVARAGVRALTASRAELLLFLDQTSERRGQKATTVAAQLSVTAELDGGHWRITAIKAR